MNYRRYIVYFALFICLASASKNETKDKTETKDKLDLKDETEMVDESESGDKQEIKEKNKTKGTHKGKGKHKKKNKKNKHEAQDYKLKKKQLSKKEHRSHIITHDYTDDAENTHGGESGNDNTNGVESGMDNIKGDNTKGEENENDYGSDLEHGGWGWHKDINAAIVPIVIHAVIDDNLITPGPNVVVPVVPCLEDGVKYHDADILDSQDNLKYTIKDCQQACANHPECKEWNWGKPWGQFPYWCSLRYSEGGEIDFRKPDVVTGTKYCDTDGYIDSGDKPNPAVAHLIVDSQYNDEKINFIKGNYWRNEQTQEGFPVYQHERGIPYIFVNYRRQWVIGKDPNENGGYAYNDQRPTPLAPPPTGWLIDYNGVWRYDDTFEAFNPDGGEPYPDYPDHHPGNHHSDYSMSGGVGLGDGNKVAAPVIIKTDIGPRIALDGASPHQIAAKIKTFVDQTIPNRGHGGDGVWEDYKQEEKH